MTLGRLIDILALVHGYEAGIRAAELIAKTVRHFVSVFWRRGDDIMGQWQTERGKGSDAMADILGAAFAKIGNLPEGPTVLDLADAIEFVSRGMLVVELHDDVPQALIEKRVKFIELLEKESIFMTIPNRGQVRPREERPAHHF